MKLICQMLLAIALAAGAAGAPAQTAYRWVDKNGQVNYADQPPPNTVRKVEERRLGVNRIEGGDSYSLSKASQDFPVTLYTAASCLAECRMAREFLAKRGITAKEVVLGDAAEQEAFRRTFSSTELLVPAITVGASMKMRGFESSTWERMLDDAGYPAAKGANNTPAAPQRTAAEPARNPTTY